MYEWWRKRAFFVGCVSIEFFYLFERNDIESADEKSIKSLFSLGKITNGKGTISGTRDNMKQKREPSQSTSELSIIITHLNFVFIERKHKFDKNNLQR